MLKLMLLVLKKFIHLPQHFGLSVQIREDMLPNFG
ncbi:Uncharacterised protein [Salmonella enterica subsp. enterica serovar Typhimurium str. DT104]|nr:Uncharacterised protein [Salmonella enterica subsp. enterica serovar Typhimurium str. DT104]